MNRTLLALLLFPVAVVAQAPRPSSLGWSDAWLDFPVSIARHNHSALTTNRFHLQLDMRPIGTVVTNFASAWCYYTSGNPTNSHMRLFENEQASTPTTCPECSVEAGQGFTVMAWFWVPEIPQQHAILASSYSFSDPHGGWYIRVLTNLAFEGAIRAGCNAYIGVAAPPNSVTLNRWHHGAMVRNSSGQLMLYVDGQYMAISSLACNGAIPVGGYRTLEFGGAYHAFANEWVGGFRGCVVGFRFYRRQLSDIEIMTIYSEGPP